MAYSGRSPAATARLLRSSTGSSSHTTRIPSSPNSASIGSRRPGIRGRCEREGGVAELAAAIASYEEALAHPRLGTADRPGCQISLAYALCERHWLDGGSELDRAVDLCRAALDATTRNGCREPGHLSVLGVALRHRHRATGSLEDLAGSLGAHRESLEATPAGAAARPRRASNLSNALLDAFAQSGQLADLDEAVRLQQEAVAEADPDGGDFPWFLNNLGSALSARYEATGGQTDLAAAVDAHKQAVERLSPNDPRRPLSLSNLGNALRDHCEATGDLVLLSDAVAAHREAVRSAPKAAPDRAWFWSNLGSALLTQFSKTGDDKALDDALAAYEHALRDSPADAVDRPRYLANTANALRERHLLSGRPADLVRARRLYTQACRSGFIGAVATSLFAARDWGDWAAYRGQWKEAAQALGQGLAAIQELFTTQLLRQDKETWLGAARGLPARLAYARLRSGDPEGAAVAVERGRALLLRETLERDRADLEHLRALGGEDLVDRYRDTLAEWAAATRTAGGRSTPALRRARTRLDDTVAAIRMAAGSDGFLAAPTVDDIRAAAAPGLLVYLVTAPWGGAAVAVTAGQITRIELPQLTDRAVREQVAILWAAYARRLHAPNRWRDAVDAVGAWLWPRMAAPLLQLVPSGRTVTFVAAGPLGFLPLHAAWTPDDEAPTGRRYLLDDWVVSYAPSATALQAARTVAASVEPDGLLVVDVSGPAAGEAPLPYAAAEVTAAAAAFPADRVRVLRGEAATPQAVFGHLAAHPVHHLCCHSRAVTASPLESGLQLAGSVLRVRELLKLRLAERPDAGARLTVLSACETGFSGAVLPDEVVSLPAALVQAGLGGIVASLWAVGDLSAALLMLRFYDLWPHGGRSPSAALRAAQQWVRDTTNREKAAYLSERDGLPAAAARSLWRRLMLLPPHQRNLAAPSAWAAFTHFGA